MTEEEQEPQELASEEEVVEPDENVEAEGDNQKMVPLSAMIANRKKAQEEARRADKAEAEALLYREMLMKANNEVPESEEDLSALVERKDLKGLSSSMKREIMEQLYQDMNQKGVQKIDKYLNAILEKKPWLKQSIDSALNRYARAEEIVDDYMHLVNPSPSKKQAISDGQRVIQNANKPGSPMAAGKSAYPTGAEYLKSIQGTKEFREYRQKLLRGEA